MRHSSSGKPPHTLAIDIGGNGIKARVLDDKGKPLTKRVRISTPNNATPRKVIEIISKLAESQPEFARVAVGFPGICRDGVVRTAPNLNKRWAGFNLAQALGGELKRPVRVTNDADMQGLGCVSGSGIELFITLGTGFGAVLFVNGYPVHLELKYPFRKGGTYQEELGNRALKKKGRRKWSRHLAQAMRGLRDMFGYDRLYIGGGNNRYIKLDLPPEVEIVSNEQGLLGGIALWRE